MNSHWRLLLDFGIIAILLFGVALFRAPRTARAGNLAAALALAGALIAVLLVNPLRDPAVVILALLAGGAAGVVVAMRTKMIQMPAMIAFQHGMGGIAAFLTSLVELNRAAATLPVTGQMAGLLGITVGAATFSGSLIASGKLAGVLRQTPVLLPRHAAIQTTLLVAILALGALVLQAAAPALLYGSLALILVAVALGVVFALPIGGADMPVLISFLNATAGLAAAFCGIIIQNRLLIACGATVAASGSILTYAMCRAMNRSLRLVLMPAPQTPAASLPHRAAGCGRALPSRGGETREPSAEEAGQPRWSALAALRAAQSIIIPGYGMALAQAQFELAHLTEKLRAMGRQLRFAIHPIAGRMPGHMHVLLAEAEIDADLLFDLPDINADFEKTDLALVVGACDVVNPAAVEVEGTPISGMPILEARAAKQVVVCNLDTNPGYSGVANSLYTNAKTILVLGDAKAALEQLRRGWAHRQRQAKPARHFDWVGPRIAPRDPFLSTDMRSASGAGVPCPGGMEATPRRRRRRYFRLESSADFKPASRDFRAPESSRRGCCSTCRVSSSPRWEHAAVPADMLALLCHLAGIVAQPVAGVAGDVQFAVRIAARQCLPVLSCDRCLSRGVVLRDVEINRPRAQRLGEFFIAAWNRSGCQ